MNKKRPELHYAINRRCYNEALCAIRKEIQAIEPEFHTVYFPAEGKYSGWIKYKEITGMHEDVGDALLEAWDKLIGEKQ